ncbi:IclR family transcriptional regulator [Halobellus captivus]|uniref:IclR family transcriptional regulator n=1 Tax=Halobellus captivus TaxID=2592614 RepID=UPI00119EE21E|nr:IclR family transcriptional regulator [Halobellus captivus]
MTNSGSPHHLTTIENAFRIVEILREADEATLSDIAAELDLAISTVHDYLTTLENLEYVVKEDGTYRVGMQFYEIGKYVKRSNDLLGEVRPVLKEIADETDEVVWYIIEEHGKAVYLESVPGRRAVPTYAKAGERTPMHCVAAGKVILAHYPKARVQEIFERQGMDKRTENTITDQKSLFEEFERIQEQGVGFNDEESVYGVRAVATPVFDGEEIAGAISVPGPANRLVNDRWRTEIPEILLAATNELDLRLRYSD